MLDAALASKDPTINNIALRFLDDGCSTDHGLGSTPPEEDSAGIPEDLSWKARAGRTQGGEGYHFGDFSRAKLRGLKLGLPTPPLSSQSGGGGATSSNREAQEATRGGARRPTAAGNHGIGVPPVGEVTVSFGSCWCQSRSNWWVELTLCGATHRTPMQPGSTDDTRRGAGTAKKLIDFTVTLPVVDVTADIFVTVKRASALSDDVVVGRACVPLASLLGVWAPLPQAQTVELPLFPKDAWSASPCGKFAAGVTKMPGSGMIRPPRPLGDFTPMLTPV